MTGWRWVISATGAIGGLLCAAALDMAWSQSPQDAAACQQRVNTGISEVTENYDKALRTCGRDRDEMSAKLEAAQGALAKLKQQPPPAADSRAIGATADILKRLRPMSEGESDLSKALATIDGDVKSLLDERDALRATATALQDKVEKLEHERELAIRKVKSDQLAALDKALQRPCALLSRVETGDDGYRIEGLLPGGAKARDRLQQDLERVVPGAIRAISVASIESDVCLTRLDEEWALARTGGEDASGPLEVVLGPGVSKLVAVLPSSGAACSRAFAALHATAGLRDLLPGTNDEALLWASRDGELMLCQGGAPHDPQSWRMRGGFRPGKAALLVIVAGKAAGAGAQVPGTPLRSR